MKALSRLHYPTSSEAELDRLHRVCEQLGGFDERVSIEWLDGALTALAAGPRPQARPVAEWRERLFGDAWPRAFADPEADAEASAALQSRWNVLLRQLDPEPLLDALDEVRLAPVLIDWSEDGTSGTAGPSHPSEPLEDDAPPRTGELWAHGFIEAVQIFSDDWAPPAADTPERESFDDTLMRIGLLTLRDEGELKTWTDKFYPGETMTRDDLVQEALFAAQDLRIHWVDHAPRTETRRVGKQPGRNEPCHCGSGKKFKKCHGA